MKLTTIHETYLRNIATAKHSFLAAKADADERARQIVRTELAGHQFEIDRLVRIAADAGIPLGKIGSYWKGSERMGLLTDDYGTVRASLERTRGIPTITSTAETVAAEVANERYSLADGALKITLTADELFAAKRAVNFDDTEATAPDSAVFELDHKGRLACIDGDTVPNSYERNPVVFWAYESANEAEALAWYHAQSAQVAA